MDTPLFELLGDAILSEHWTNVGIAEALSDEALPDEAYDHALMAFAPFHPLRHPEIAWREAGEQEMWGDVPF